jgi:hypothetical protein
VKLLTSVSYAFAIVSIAALAACGANGTVPAVDGTSVQTLNTLLAMTNVQHRGKPIQHRIVHSWMETPPKGITGTIWASDVTEGTVDLIGYPGGTLIGQVAGFAYPYGLCSDKSGNVYVADFSREEGFEIAAGTTSVINSWATGGEAIGCSVSNSGDVAFTNFYPGGVVVFPGGGPTGTTYFGPGYDFPAAYDKKGNLFAECDYESPCSTPRLAELSGGTWHVLDFDQTITFPGAVQLMGTVLGVADQEPDGAFNMAIYGTKVNGSNAHDVKTVIFTGAGSCSADFASSWASLSKKPDGVQSVKGAVKDIAAEDSDCYPGGVDVWNAKKGGAPITSFDPVSDASYAGATFTK